MISVAPRQPRTATATATATAIRTDRERVAARSPYRTFPCRERCLPRRLRRGGGRGSRPVRESRDEGAGGTGPRRVLVGLGGRGLSLVSSRLERARAHRWR